MFQILTEPEIKALPRDSKPQTQSNIKILNRPHKAECKTDLQSTITISSGSGRKQGILVSVKARRKIGFRCFLSLFRRKYMDRIRCNEDDVPASARLSLI